MSGPNLSLGWRKKMTKSEQARWNAHVAVAYDRELTLTPEDREDMARESERRENIRSQKEEWEYDCSKDDALTLTKSRETVVCIPERDWRTSETEEEREEREWREWFRRDVEKKWNRKWE